MVSKNVSWFMLEVVSMLIAGFCGAIVTLAFLAPIPGREKEDIHTPLTATVFSRDYPARVLRVVDGDTIDLMIDLGFDITAQKRIRLTGVDAPELPTPEGKASAAAVKSWLDGKDVRLRTNKDMLDKYGRQLGDVISDGSSVSERLLAEKLAVPYGK